MKKLEYIIPTILVKEAARGDQLIKNVQALITRATKGTPESASDALFRLDSATNWGLQREGSSLHKELQSLIPRVKPGDYNPGKSRISAIFGKPDKDLVPSAQNQAFVPDGKGLTKLTPGYEKKLSNLSFLLKDRGLK